MAYLIDTLEGKLKYEFGALMIENEHLKFTIEQLEKKLAELQKLQEAKQTD